ncbi:MAG: ABC transporter ATP-binding protein [Candidatus Eremiobacteraeota bacterium]|nr:ABC transporter ATP-binding protein [Candidatus Eremiobacteraeota bacterium]
MSERNAVSVEALTVAHGAVQATRDLSFRVERGEVVTLLGPSGCGKTTTLRAIAGLDTPQSGRISIDGRTVFDAGSGVNIPPENRGLSMVFQSYAIWPHMSVFENVAFGLRARGGSDGNLDAQVRKSLALVGLADFARRPATRLSGGQQQRVALARAITGNPGVILLDEPLSNLDAQLRLAMRTEFRELQRRLGLAAVYVTHDQEEALVLSDRILVMRDGAVEQSGTPAEIHDTPRTRFVAEFVGVRNVLPCEVASHNGHLVAKTGHAIQIAVRGIAPQQAACVAFRPSAVRLSPVAEPGFFAATLASATYLGDLVQYELRAGGHVIYARALPRTTYAVGSTVYWTVDPEAAFLVEASC